MATALLALIVLVPIMETPNWMSVAYVPETVRLVKIVPECRMETQNSMAAEYAKAMVLHVKIATAL